MGTCPACEKLERRYRRAVRRIYAVVDQRFGCLADKLRALHREQDQRDAAIEALYAHQKSHRIQRSRQRENRDVA